MNLSELFGFDLKEEQILFDKVCSELNEEECKHVISGLKNSHYFWEWTFRGPPEERREYGRKHILRSISNGDVRKTKTSIHNYNIVKLWWVKERKRK